ncbi:MAG: hypothetical protein EBS05_21580 [Proteobacteria bacterium]|nr:hypothetical protein [Pseudomonadota bacterium]
MASAGAVVSLPTLSALGQAAPDVRLASFSADVTVPMGHGMMGGSWLSKSVADPLFAKGIVLLGSDKPVVLVSVDWCEIRNAAFDRWRSVLAEAAGTEPVRVLVSSTHVHDAPVADLEAERILKEHECVGTVCDVKFHEEAVQRVAAALRESLKTAARVTQLGLGQARVEKVASNRRYLLPDGKIYFSGCSGNVTAGKYNPGMRENRVVLAGRIYQAMAEAWRDTKKTPLEKLAFRSVPLTLEPRNDPEGFTVAGSEKLLAAGQKPFTQCLAAMNLSWRKRAATGQPIDVPLVDFGPAQFLLLPAESYVEYQLHAQTVRPDSFVMVAGYGESAPGYIPIERAWDEKDSNLGDWCWVAPGSEARMKAAIEQVLKP